MFLLIIDLKILEGVLKKELNNISGDYQYKALKEGNIIQRYWHSNKIDLIVRKMKIQRQDLVLDAGCGSGNIVFEFAKNCRIICGIDIFFDALIFAKVTTTNNNCKFLLSSICDTPFKSNSFDKIICSEVIEHLDQQSIKRVFESLYRILKPGGKLIITTPNYQSLWPLIEFLLDCFKLTPKLKGKQHISKLNLNLLTNIIKDKGFKVEEFGSFNHVSPFLSILSEKFARKIFKLEMEKGGMIGNLLYCVCSK